MKLARLEIQAGLLTEGLGGVWGEEKPGILDGRVQILDVACGPGEWVRQVAELNALATVTGLDISQIMVAYARMKAPRLSISPPAWLSISVR